MVISYFPTRAVNSSSLLLIAFQCSVMHHLAQVTPLVTVSCIMLRYPNFKLKVLFLNHPQGNTITLLFKL